MNIQTSLTFCGNSDHCLLAFCENLNANILFCGFSQKFSTAKNSDYMVLYSILCGFNTHLPTMMPNYYTNTV